MGVHVERRLEIRIPEQSLGGLERFAIRMQKRCMGVTERVPRNPWLPDPIARRCELPVVWVLVVERSALRGLKDQLLRSCGIRTRAFKRGVAYRIYPDPSALLCDNLIYWTEIIVEQLQHAKAWIW